MVSVGRGWHGAEVPRAVRVVYAVVRGRSLLLWGSSVVLGVHAFICLLHCLSSVVQFLGFGIGNRKEL